MNKPDLDIIMPVYNEGENVLDALRALECSVKTSFRVLICYDFDEDNTLTALQGAKYNFEIVPVKNCGRGVHSAIMTGFNVSTARALVTFPADESYNAGIIDGMYAKIKEGNDVVVASRLIKGGEMSGGPRFKSFLVRLGSFLLHRFAFLPATDATYGWRMFSRRILDTVEIESTAGFTYAIELLVKCHRLRWKVAEVPAKWLMRQKGQSRFNLKKWLPHYTRWFFYTFATTYFRKGPETVKLKLRAKTQMNEKETSKVVTHCQVCGHAPLEPILFLGYLPPAEDFHSIGERPKEEPSYPAEILYCSECHLVQSGLIVNQNIIFPKSYAYISSNTKLLRDNFAELYREVNSMFGLKSDDLVIDIGSNDGNLLSNFKDHTRVLGVTPEDIGKIAIERGIPTILDYFTRDVARKIKKEYGTAKVITATNAFAHIDNVNDVVDSILEILKDDGLFISESHYLLQLIKMNQFDSVYHEHLRHYSLHSLKYLLEKHGLQIIHAKQIPTHAGSIRVYAARAGKHAVTSTVAPLLEEEKHAILSKEALEDFRKKTILAKLDLVALLRDIKKQGGRVYGIGAPFRGTTLIKYVGIDEGIVDCVLEVNSSPKIDKYIPGTIIPILEESKLFLDQPEYALIFSWQIADELIPKLKAKGFKGKFIVPLPTPRVV